MRLSFLSITTRTTLIALFFTMCALPVFAYAFDFLDPWDPWKPWEPLDPLPTQPLEGVCSVSPTSIFTGQSATWSAIPSGGSGSYTYSWSGTDSLAGTSAQVMKIYTTSGTKNASVIITSGSEKITVQCSNTLTVSAQSFPNLTTGSITPTTATAGTARSFSVTVSNIGNALAGQSTTRFQRATSSGGANATTIANVSTASIAAGSTSTVSTSYTFPNAGTWFIRACADANNNITESNENNNCGPWTAVGVALPNASCTPSSSQSITLTYSDPSYAANAIWVNTALTKSVYVPGEPMYATGSIASDDYPMACPQLSVNGVAFNLGCHFQSILPATRFVGNAPSTAGTYQMWWHVYNEGDYLLPQICPMTYTVTEPQLPNLRISSGPSPTTATAGQSRTYSAVVHNNGNASAGSSTTRFQRATSSAGANATTIANVSTASIAAGSTRTVSTSYTHPTSGTFWIRACADATNTVTESNEHDNCSGWVAVSVASVPAPSVSLTASPTSINAGQSAMLFWSSSGAAYCMSNDFNTNYNLAGSVTVSPAQTRTYTIQCGTNPTWVTGNPDVTYEDNIALAFATVTVIQPLPNLHISSGPSPTTATAGQSRTYSAVVQNNGNASAGSSTTRFQRATSSAGANATTIANVSTASIAAGSTRTVSTSYTHPTSGTFWIRACADATNTVTESNEHDNCSGWVAVNVSNPPVTASCSVSPTSIFTGQSATWSVSASGGTGSYTYSWSGTDGLAGSTANVSRIYTSAGTKTASVTVSSGGQSTTAQCSNSVTVTVQPLPNLTAGSITPTTATAGTVRSFSVTVSNIGNALAGSSTTRFQRATSSGGANATTIGNISTASIAAGSSSSVSVSHTFPSAGTWFIRACADANNNVTESNENNNCGPWTAVSAASACVPDGGVVEVLSIGSCPVMITVRESEPRCCSGMAVVGGQYGCNVTCVSPGLIPPPTASLSANPTAVVLGNSSTLSWSSTNAYSCTGVNFNTSGVISGSVTVSPTQTTTYTVTCAGLAQGGGSASASATVSVSAPNLHISSGPSPTTATAGQSRTYSAVVQNNGNASAGQSTTRFQRATSSGGANATTIANVSTASIAAGSTRTVSTSYTHPTSGTFWIRACADATNTVTESNENDNCSGWVAVNVSNPPVTASCSVSPTSIFTGQSATWSASASGGSGSYTYSWSGTDGLAGSTANVSRIYTSAGTKSGSVTVSSGGQSTTVQCSNSVTVTGRPDLIADGVSPASATAQQSATLSTVIRNIGDASSGASFTNTFFIDNNTNHSTVHSTRTVSTSALGAGAQRTVQTSFTFPNAGTWYVRACADQNASGQGTIVESNENNNCTQWSPITVMPFPVPVANLSVTPASIDRGASALLSWSSSNANSCTGVNFNTGGTTSGSVTVSPTQTTTYTLTCSGIGGSDSDSKTLTVIQRPDLIIQPNQVTMPESIVLEVEPEDAGQGAQAALSATVRNNGTGSTGSSFTNTFFINSTPSHTAGQSTQSRTMSALNAGASRLFEASHTFPSSGTYYVRACADQNASGQGTIVESNENNNCTPWRSITVSITVLPPRGSVSLTAQPAIVAPSQSANLVWSTTNMQSNSCSLTGPNGNIPLSPSPVSTGPITGTATYTLRCTDLRGDIQTASATVNVVPEFQEF